MKDSKKNPYALGAIGEVITKLGLLFVSFSLALNISRFFRLPYKNPYNISSPGNAIHFMPNNNYLRVIAVIGITIGLFYAFQWLFRKSNLLARLTLVGLFSLFVFFGFIAPSYSHFVGNVDVFHHGEQLGPGLAFYEGKTLFKDVFFLHGAGEDAVLPALSFHIFGKSIGSYYLLNGLLEGLSAAIFIFLIHVLIKQRDLFILALVWLTSTTYSTFYYVRDIFVWINILLVYLLFSRSMSVKKQLGVYFGVGVVSALAMFHSIDRGIYLLALDVFVVIATALLVEGKTQYELAPKAGLVLKAKKIVSLGVGYLIVYLAGLAYLRPAAFTEFLKMTLRTIPKFEGMMFDGPIANLDKDTLLFWIPIMVATLLTLILIKQVTKRQKKFDRPFAFAVVFLLFALVFLKGGTGMADTPHMAYATPVLFLCAFYIFSITIPKISWKGMRWTEVWPVFVAAALMFCLPTYNLLKIPAYNQVSTPLIKNFFRMYKQPDSYWLPQTVKDTRDYITSHSSPGDSVFVMSSQPIYYYLADRNNPSRFYITWFADPQPYTNEMLASLKKDPPKYIIYQTGNYYDRPQFIPMTERVPEVNQWILDNYKHDQTLDGTVIIKSK